MSKRSAIFTISLCLFVLHINGKGQSRPPSGSKDFDLLIFTQHWPQTVCYTWKESSSNHKCALPSDHDEWTIHGIWPDQYHSMGPQFCNDSMQFDPHALKPLVAELQERWIDIQYGKSSYDLWKHEWNKHGTCAAVLEPMNTEVKYFAEGLKLLSVYDMKNVLAKANILPGKAYRTTTILDAIERILGKRGVVICRTNKNTGESYIFEIRICLDKSLALIDCDGISEYPTNCGTLRDVIYPGEVPQRYRVVQV